MDDFLTRLVDRNSGSALTAQPVIPPMFARAPDMPGDPALDLTGDDISFPAKLRATAESENPESDIRILVPHTPTVLASTDQTEHNISPDDPETLEAAHNAEASTSQSPLVSNAESDAASQAEVEQASTTSRQNRTSPSASTRPSTADAPEANQNDEKRSEYIKVEVRPASAFHAPEGTLEKLPSEIPVQQDRQQDSVPTPSLAPLDAAPRVPDQSDSPALQQKGAQEKADLSEPVQQGSEQIQPETVSVSRQPQSLYAPDQSSLHGRQEHAATRNSFASETTIKVTIGRVEVRANMLLEPPKERPKAQKSGSVLPLDEYLEQFNGER